MTREELKEHCEKQIENCEMWARCIGEEPHGKIYEEHKLILELLEQEPCEDCISRQAVLEYIEGSEAELGHDSENELVCQDIKELPPVASKLCEDAISRQAVNVLVDELARAISDERCCIPRGRSTAIIMQDILDLPPVKSQEPTEWQHDHEILKAYSDGANEMLDKIRAEIKQIADEEQKHDKKWTIGLRYAVKIINKYKSESEDENE